MSPTTESLIFSQPIHYIHTLHEAFEYCKEEVSFPYLMGISGEAFRFFYNRFEPEAGMNTFFHNPLRATCRALGFRHEILYDETYQAAYERLQENIRTGKPALLPFSNCCPFLIEGELPETVICQNGSRYKLHLEDLREKWEPGGGFLELGPHGWYQFVLGNQEREPKEREIALGSFRCAQKLMQTSRRIHDCAVGLNAYQELIAHLTNVLERKTKLTEQEVCKIAKWFGQPLLQCIEARKAAHEYLQLVRKHFEGEELEHLDKAIAAYQQVVLLLTRLRMTWSPASNLPAPRQAGSEDFAPTNENAKFESESDESFACARRIASRQAKRRREMIKEFKSRCRGAIKLLQKIYGAEKIGVEALKAVVRISEKLKM